MLAVVLQFEKRFSIFKKIESLQPLQKWVVSGKDASIISLNEQVVLNCWRTEIKMVNATQQ